VLDRLVQYWQKMKRPRKLFDALVDWIQFRGPGTPFFLMTNVLNVHYPWAPPPFPLLKRLRFNPRHLLQSEFVIPKPFSFNSGKKRITPLHRAVWHSLYEAAVEHVDREVGRFLRLLRQIEGGEDVIVVITSDHGEMLGDRGLVGHTLSLHDNILHVPLIIQHPGWPSGLTIEGVVQTVDLYSSVVDWAGVPLETIPSAQLQRSSYSDAVASPDSLSGYAFAEEDYTESYNVIEGLLSVNPDMDPHRYPRRQVAVHSANHKYIWYDDRPAAFYDLRTDPLEERNLLDSSEQVSVVEDLRQALGHWRERLDLFPPRGVDDRVEADEEVVRRLRNLGYIA
jgi:arylsulfatase A-like enzyme